MSVAPELLPQHEPQLNVLHAAGTLDPDTPVTELRLHDGRSIRLSTADLLREQAPYTAPHAVPSDEDAEDLVIPIVEEQLHVEKRVVETGKVRLHKTTEQVETTVDELLTTRTFDVERVPRNEVVASTPAVRQEGNTTIYPIVEEEVVVSRQLVLKEELHVTLRETVRRDTRPVTVQRERIEVERTPVLQSPTE